MAQSPTSTPSSAIRALQLELKKIQGEPVEGFRVQLANDEDISEWEVAIFGPPGTLYEGGYFKVCIPSTCLDILKTFNRICSHISIKWTGFLCSRPLCYVMALVRVVGQHTNRTCGMESNRAGLTSQSAVYPQLPP